VEEIQVLLKSDKNNGYYVKEKVKVFHYKPGVAVGFSGG
jgi:hypothetical protein